MSRFYCVAKLEYRAVLQRLVGFLKVEAVGGVRLVNERIVLDGENIVLALAVCDGERAVADLICAPEGEAVERRLPE